MAAASTAGTSASAPSWRGLREFGLLAAVAGLGAAAALLFPDDLGLLTRILGMSFLVLALDLVVGFCGIATLGHAALYGAGAYAAGYASARLGVADPLLLVAIGIAAGALAGLATGAVILRTTGLPQLVLSIATVQLAHEAANKFSGVTGGSDGLSGITVEPVFGLFAFDLWGRTAYWLSLVLLVVTLGLLRAFVRSPFGLLCRAIREDPVRVRALGAPAYPALLRMYVVSGAVAGIGGALTAVTAGVVGLDSLSFERSAQALVMLVLGGAGTLYGALIGAVAFAGFEHIVSAANPFHWLATMGALLVVVTLFLPKGLQGLPGLVLARIGRRPISPDPHAEVAGPAGPRSTRSRSASFEAGLRPAPQDEEVGSLGLKGRVDDPPTDVIPGLAGGENPEPTTGRDGEARSGALTRSWVSGSAKFSLGPAEGRTRGQPRNDRRGA